MKTKYSLNMANTMLKAIRKKELKNEKSEVIELFADWLCFIAENSDKVKFI
jgi:hypothetical protein